MDIQRRSLPMATKIQKWGNSQGLRLAKQVLEDAHISVGDDVDATTKDGLIVIAPSRRIRGKRSLKELDKLLAHSHCLKCRESQKDIGHAGMFIVKCQHAGYWDIHQHTSRLVRGI
jgi:antitoxin MazE